jgi:hypothetical protein
LVRLSFAIELKYEIGEQPADFVFNIHAARTPSQALVSESLAISPHLEPVLQTDPLLGNRYMRLRASPGPLAVRYEATVDIRCSPSSTRVATASPTGCTASRAASSGICRMTPMLQVTDNGQITR